VRLAAACVWLASEGVALSAQLAALLIAAKVDRVSLSGPREALILRGVAQCRSAEMAINLDRLSPLVH